MRGGLLGAGHRQVHGERELSHREEKRCVDANDDTKHDEFCSPDWPHDGPEYYQSNQHRSRRYQVCWPPAVKLHEADQQCRN